MTNSRQEWWEMKQMKFKVLKKRPDIDTIYLVRKEGVDGYGEYVLVHIGTVPEWEAQTGEVCTDDE